jgi:threonine synthase
MLYVSTRGNNNPVSSAHAIKEGLAPDGGLYVPQSFPTLALDEILSMHRQPYAVSAVSVLRRYLTDYQPEELMACATAAYTEEKFGKQPVVLRKVADRTDVLELWHGPTMAFKDMALQILPHLMTLAQDKTGEEGRIVILAATSGDTGKAALEGFADVQGTEVIVFYPDEGVSPIQKLQMTTQEGENTAVFGIQGNFDDAQRGVKEIFHDKELAERLQGYGWTFSSANSINWGRLVPQIVYYFRAYADAVAEERIQPGEPVLFCVPTGNFGDILAGYYAHKMGLPVKRFICASNTNNVLTDFINTGKYNRNRELHKTISPSMDILVSSNLERLLYDMTGGKSDLIANWMEQLNTEGTYAIPTDLGDDIRYLFQGFWVDEQETKDTIGAVFNDFGYVLDPHTAVAWHALEKYRLVSSDETYAIVLSTASPFKFSQSVLEGLNKGETVQGDDPFAAARQLHDVTGLPVPPQVTKLQGAPVLHKDIIVPEQMTAAILDTLEVRY